MLFVDSIQTVRAKGTMDADGPRARVDAVMAALKRIAKSGPTVIATCELARGAYASRNAADRTNDLAAFKESGGIEYGVGMAIVLRSVPDEAALIDVTIPKNRFGTREPFRLQLDYRHARFEETGMPDAEVNEFGGDALAKAKQRIVTLLAHDNDVRTKNDFVRRVGGRKTIVLAALEELMEREIVVLAGGVYRLKSEVSE